MKRTITALSIAAALMLAGCSTTGTADDASASAAPAGTEAAPAPAESTPEAADVPSEYKSALKSAENYSKIMHMSKAGLYDQLTSEYGDKFAPEAAQYAIDNIEADWNANALESAKNYQETMAMSPEGIRDQLTSEYGDKFTPEEADHAVTNLP